MTNVGNSDELCTEINVTFDISINSRNAKLGSINLQNTLRNVYLKMISIIPRK